MADELHHKGVGTQLMNLAREQAKPFAEELFPLIDLRQKQEKTFRWNLARSNDGIFAFS